MPYTPESRGILRADVLERAHIESFDVLLDILSEGDEAKSPAIVREIAANHNERPRVNRTPQFSSHFPRGLKIQLSDHDRYQLEIAEHMLQQRNLDLDAVLVVVGLRDA